eukprot:Lithocolla_globosa_v1_NODE_96_length_6498_cov_20.614310.p6 type:complete len:197 gc:universal NODE_96_length_6498_cov_20.614310:1954-1364(-)
MTSHLCKHTRRCIFCPSHSPSEHLTPLCSQNVLVKIVCPSLLTPLAGVGALTSLENPDCISEVESMEHSLAPGDGNSASLQTECNHFCRTEYSLHNTHHKILVGGFGSSTNLESAFRPSSLCFLRCCSEIRHASWFGLHALHSCNTLPQVRTPATMWSLFGSFSGPYPSRHSRGINLGGKGFPDSSVDFGNLVPFT